MIEAAVRIFLVCAGIWTAIFGLLAGAKEWDAGDRLLVPFYGFGVAVGIILAIAAVSFR